VYEREGRRKKKKERNKEKGSCEEISFLNFSKMLRTVLLLDGSEAMNSTVDYLPSRLLALRPHILRLVESMLESAFAAQVAAVVMRDGVAHRVSAASSSVGEIADRLEKAYFMFGGVGSMSLDNGLRLALSELVPVQVGGSAVLGSHLQSQLVKRRVIFVCASVTSVDHSDIYALVKLLRRHRVAVDVLSICGATHLSLQLAAQTGGRFVCPMNYDEMRTAVDSFVESPPSLVEDANNTPTMPIMLPVAFPLPVVIAATRPGGASTGSSHHATSHCDEMVVCSRCALPLTSVPSTCPQCRVLVCSLPYVHVAHAKALGLAPIAERVSGEVLSSSESCAECNTRLGTNKKEAFRCCGCARYRCQDCEAYIRTVLHVCPSCAAAAAASY
jgi:transcription initiation factor TFIIH subunit 2